MNLEDRIAIGDLLSLYGHVLDLGQWDRIGELFTRDAVFDAGTSTLPPMRGIDEILERLPPLEDPYPNQSHHATNVVIEEKSAARAIVRSKFLVLRLDGILSVGEYLDEVVRAEDGWRIRRRTARRIGTVTSIDAPAGMLG